MQPTTPDELCSILKSLKMKQSSGFDNLSLPVLKWISAICKPFSEIVNLSFSSGVVPYKLKIARIVPVFKNGDINNSIN